ncbi:White-opaque regulator 1-like protein 2 [Seiridium cupressi]
MVYCGKASQGCQNCRQRRIKCDKVKPECSQCIRVGKKCPGYRDQLSLMFRDESSKVIQKAHAQWGTATTPPSAASASAPSSSASWASSPSATTNDTRSPITESPASPAEIVLSRNMELLSPKIQAKVEPTVEQRGLQFFIEQYLMTTPDAPSADRHLAVYSGSSQAMQSVMIAVGLAGLSHKRGDEEMNLLARQKYTTALKQTSQLIATGPADAIAVMGPLRAVVTLAMFEVVQGKGSKLSTGTANIHILGAIALLKNVVPKSQMPIFGARAILQLMYSLLIPSQVTDAPLPAQFFEVLTMVRHILPPEEHCTCDLAVAIARTLHILTLSKSPLLLDGDPETDDVLYQLLHMDAVLSRLEQQLHVSLPFTVETAPKGYPPEAVFKGKYHRYIDIEAARLWNHLRWTRILVVQRIMEKSKAFPRSYSSVVSPSRTGDCYGTAQRMAEDIITSTPSHWHHPILSATQARRIAAVGKGGTGAAGLPGLLWHLKIAGCAPGVPTEFWDWSYAVAQVVWKTMGMQHALALAEVMEGHRAGMEKEAIDRLIKVEDVEEW